MFAAAEPARLKTLTLILEDTHLQLEMLAYIISFFDDKEAYKGNIFFELI